MKSISACNHSCSYFHLLKIFYFVIFYFPIPSFNESQMSSQIFSYKINSKANKIILLEYISLTDYTLFYLFTLQVLLNLFFVSLSISICHMNPSPHTHTHAHITLMLLASSDCLTKANDRESLKLLSIFS